MTNTTTLSRADKIAINNEMLAYLWTVAAECNATIAGASDDSKKFRSITRDGHMIVKICFSETSFRLCFRPIEKLKKYPGMKTVNYVLPYQFTFRENNSAKLKKQVREMIHIAFLNYDDVQDEKLRKAAEKEASKKTKKE